MRIWRQGLAVALAGLLAVAQPLPSLIGVRSLATALAVAAPAVVSLWSGDKSWSIMTQDELAQGQQMGGMTLE